MSYVQPTEGDYIAMEVQRSSAQRGRDDAGTALRKVENLELRIAKLEKCVGLALLAIEKLMKGES